MPNAIFENQWTYHFNWKLILNQVYIQIDVLIFDFYGLILVKKLNYSNRLVN